MTASLYSLVHYAVAEVGVGCGGEGGGGGQIANFGDKKPQVHLIILRE